MNRKQAIKVLTRRMQFLHDRVRVADSLGNDFSWDKEECSALRYAVEVLEGIQNEERERRGKALDDLSRAERD